MEITKNLFAIFMLSAFCYGNAAPAKELYHLPPKASENIIQGVIKCIGKIGLNSAVINQIKDGKFANDDKIVQTLVCMITETGIGTADGRINVDKTMKKLFVNKPEIRGVVEDCAKNYGKDPVENLKSFFVCFKEKAPFQIVL